MQKSEADQISQAGLEHEISCQIIRKEEEFAVLIDDKLKIYNFEAAKYLINGLVIEKEGNAFEKEDLPFPLIIKAAIQESAPIPQQEEAQKSLKVNNKEELFLFPTLLVFTTLRNVCKVKNANFTKLTQIIDHSELEPGERPLYITGTKRYTGFLIVAFENGKVGKITMESYQTEFNRKKLKGAFGGESKLVFIEHIENDIDLVAVSDINKVVLFNTSQINAVGSRTTLGVQVMKPKDRSLMVKMKKLDQVKFEDPEYYRKAEGLNAVGFYLKDGDEI